MAARQTLRMSRFCIMFDSRVEMNRQRGRGFTSLEAESGRVFELYCHPIGRSAQLYRFAIDGLDRRIHLWQDRAETDILYRCCKSKLLDKDGDVFVLGLGIDSLYELGMRGIEWLDGYGGFIKEVGNTHEGVGLEETRPILLHEKKIPSFFL